MKRKLLALLFLTLTITAILCGCSDNSQPSEPGLIFGLTGNSELAIIGDLIDADKIPAGTQQVFARYTHTEPITADEISLIIYDSYNSVISGGYAVTHKNSVDGYMPFATGAAGEYTARVFLDDTQVYEMPITVVG